LPAGFLASDIYYVRSVSGNTCKLAGQNNDNTLVIPSDVGSGNLTMYTGYASGSATVNVLQDVTSDKWATGDSVVLCNVVPQNYDQQRVTLNTINAGTLVLSATVDSTQFPLALVVLSTRNVSIQASRAANTGIVEYGTGDTHGGVFGEIRSTAGTGTTFYGYGLYYSVGSSIATISGCSDGIRDGSGHTATTISGCNNGIHYGSGHTATTISGCSNGIYYGSGHTATTISGCSNGIYYGSGHTATTISGCSNGIYYGGINARGCTLEDNTTDIDYPANSVLYASSLDSATQVSNYLGLGYASYVWSYDHGGSVGRIRSWTGGGTIVSQEWADVESGVKADCPITPDYLHLATFELATHFNFFEWPLVSDGRTTISITIYARKQQTGETDVPRFAICDMTKNFPDAAAALDAEDMADNTDWQTITLSYTPTDTDQLCLRFTAKSDSNETCYFLPVIDQVPTPAEIATAVWADETSPTRTLTA
jgi:hypothetical protein